MNSDICKCEMCKPVKKRTRQTRDTVEERAMVDGFANAESPLGIKQAELKHKIDQMTTELMHLIKQYQSLHLFNRGKGI